MRIVVVGGAGFVGSAVTRKLVAEKGASVLVVDNLSASSSLASLASISSNPRFSFRRADIREPDRVAALLQAFAPDAVIHAAAEASPAGSGADTNFVGSWRLMEAVRAYWAGLAETRRAAFRFVAVSRADAFGDEQGSSRQGVEDMLVSWHKAYGLPVAVVKSAIAFGPCQFPSALVPSAIIAALGGQASAVHGGRRDWIHVDDLAEALSSVAEKGRPGVVYAAACGLRASPAEIAERIGRLVARHAGVKATGALVEVVATAGGDALPKVDTSALERETGWSARETLDSGLTQTVRWYLANEAWWRPLAMARDGGDTFGLLRIA